MENKDKQSALMLIDLAEKLSDLAACCRVYRLKQLIHDVELNLQYNRRFSECYCGNDKKN